jgi:hypothetical protein
MGNVEDQKRLADALAQIEGSILPGISAMLDALLDASDSCRPGIDAHVYAAELRTIALQLEALSKDVEALAPPPRLAHELRSVASA